MTETLEIRPIRKEEAQPLSRLIRRVMLESNIKDYDYDFLTEYANNYDASEVLELMASGGSTYVALLDGQLCGCGAVIPDGPGQVIIRAMYVSPQHQGKGVGRAIMDRLEAEPIFRSARRAVVSSSITAHPFYAKLGYAYVGGTPVCEENDHYWMEKFPNP